MDLCSTLAARRICWLAGHAYPVRPITIGGLADLAAWLDGVLPGDRETPPRVSDDASRALLETPPGRAMVAWIGLRDAGPSFEAAALAWHDATDEERADFLAALWHRRPTLQPSDDFSDVGELWCDEGLARLAMEIGMEAVRDLTLDQLEWMLSGGNADRHADPGRKALLECQRIWEEQRRARGGAANGANGEAGGHGG